MLKKRKGQRTVRFIYEFPIELLPRYSGSYTLNPAVAECMYFAALFGREEVKQVEIK